MSERNKIEIAFFAKMLGLLVWLMLVIITCSGVWNFDKESFVCWCAVLLMAINVGAIVYLFNKWRKEHNAAIEALQDK